MAVFKVSTYIVLASFLITLEIYRIPTPIGLTVAFGQIFLGFALYVGGIVLLQGNLRLRVDQETKSVLTTFLLFAGYSFACFARNIGSMRPESASMYLSEVVGYVIVLLCAIFLSRKGDVRQVTVAFLASAVFVYLGAFWHIYNFVVLGQFVTGTPFWHEYSKSESTLTYLHTVAWTGGLPRLRLPFSSPAGTGVFLSLAGILLLVFTLHRRASGRGGTWRLVPLNLANFLCLLGTFAKASWAVFLLGTLVALYYFRKVISFGKVAVALVIVTGLFLGIVNATPMGSRFLYVIGARLDPADTWTRYSVAGHWESRVLALRYWEESPVWGLGVGGFWLKPMGGIHTHSTYFTILVERGLIGLLLFLAFLLQLFRLGQKRMRLSRKRDDGMLLYDVAFLAGLIGLCLGMLLYEMECQVVWLFLGMMLTCTNVRFPKSSEGAEGIPVVGVG